MAVKNSREAVGAPTQIYQYIQFVCFIHYGISGWDMPHMVNFIRIYKEILRILRLSE